MKLKALMLCDDAREEVGGTLTLVGVYNERVIVRSAPLADGTIEIPKLTLVMVVAGLRGVERLGYRVRTRRIEDALPDAPALAFESHDPAADEHNFVLIQSPMRFPSAGPYEVQVEVDAGGAYETWRYEYGIDVR